MKRKAPASAQRNKNEVRPKRKKKEEKSYTQKIERTFAK